LVELKLKTISKDGIAEAIAKAEHYRHLHEPEESESICHDILAVDPENQTALRILGLAITDEFTGEVSDRYSEAESAFLRLTDPYERQYYMGLLCERQAKKQMRAGRPPYALTALFHEAMRYFEEAEKIHPPKNDDAVLRWNRCARLLEKFPKVEPPEPHGAFEDHDTAPVSASPWSAKSSK
jgi:tetratricopeptide (TPR) repeat protein